MSMTELNVSFPTEKLEALRFFIGKKDQTIEQELQDFLDKTYEKMVPAQVREYVESRTEQAPVQQQVPVPEQPANSKERPARQARRQKEQAAPGPASVPEAPSESEGLAEQENQGMTMNM
ncbi:DUF6103 family protein [Dehalobacter sp. DCM]|uniref:DUF6103 family protein n=1 Tax=Dehalobacter sp. DCM TaxID=2907827 RepID=UPI00308219E7|nr:DUF6103 family protein [Dehalobacter sp. DCM]